MTHKSEDFKISAVKYYNTYEISMDEVCDIFGCSKTSLKRWIEIYKKKKSIKRNSRKSKSYKVTKIQVDYAIKTLKDYEQITLPELAKQVKKRYNSFDITSRQLGNVIRDNNKTRKRTRHKHFPATRYNRPIDKKVIDKYNKVLQYKQDRINYLIELMQTNLDYCIQNCGTDTNCKKNCDVKIFNVPGIGLLTIEKMKGELDVLKKGVDMMKQIHII